MPSFAELKEQAKKAQQQAGSQFNSLRDRVQSGPSSSTTNTSSNTYHRPPPPVAKKPPPPPPIRTSNTSTPSYDSASSPPPTPARSVAPPPSRFPTRTPTSAGQAASGTSHIAWGSLTQEDKEAFFSLLDEYFARIGLQESEPARLPPPVAMKTRPSETHTQTALHSQALTLDTPPSSTTASSLCAYFSTSTPWPTPWFDDASSPLPPPLKSTRDVQAAGSWSQQGDRKTRLGYVLFADLSVAWYRVVWSVRALASNSSAPVEREARYRPPPSPWDGPLLVWAHELYGESLALFAERAAASGRHVARGECWDLAHEGLKSILADPDTAHFPAPVGSISRTHGHLIFAGVGAADARKQVGRWRGGDDCVRRGDIVEWNSVKIRTTSDSPHEPGLIMMLGDPEHTAIIVSAPSTPIPTASDGASVLPSELGWLEVVEQSRAHPPVRRKYDMRAFSEGRVWIYRAVPVEDYVGKGLEPVWPPEEPAYAL